MFNSHIEKAKKIQKNIDDLIKSKDGEDWSFLESVKLEIMRRDLYILKKLYGIEEAECEDDEE